MKYAFLTALERTSRVMAALGVGKIPGAKAVYHALTDLFWLWPVNHVRDIEGSKMYLNPLAKGPLKYAFRSFIKNQGKESITTKLFKESVKEGFTVVDMGANIGYFTLLAARLVGKTGKVYAFEPSPVNYNILLKNISLNNYANVVAEQKAVSSSDSKVKLYLSDMDVGSNTLREKHDQPQFAQKQFGDFVEVQAVALDSYFKGNGSRINAIKMDIEGAEMAALLGMDGIIRGNRNLKMFIEFYPTAIREMGHSPEDFIRKLFQYGFSISAIDELRTPTSQLTKVKTVDDLMSLCTDKEKILNLFLEK